MLGEFIVDKIRSDGFCERYAMVTWIENKTQLGLYFLIGNENVCIGDVLKGEIIINCAQICDPVNLTNKIEMVTHFDTVHDTDVIAEATILSIDGNTLYCDINSEFCNVRVELLDEFNSEKYSLNDKIYIKGLLELELLE